MSKTISISDALYAQLEKQAQETEQPIEAVLQGLVSNALSEKSVSSLIDQITEAYAKNISPPVVGSWESVEADLKETLPYFDTLEAAMDASRGRKS